MTDGVKYRVSVVIDRIGVAPAKRVRARTLTATDTYDEAFAYVEEILMLDSKVGRPDDGGTDGPE